MLPAFGVTQIFTLNPNSKIPVFAVWTPENIQINLGISPGHYLIFCQFCLIINQPDIAGGTNKRTFIFKAESCTLRRNKRQIAAIAGKFRPDNIAGDLQPQVMVSLSEDKIATFQFRAIKTRVPLAELQNI